MTVTIHPSLIAVPDELRSAGLVVRPYVLSDAVQIFAGIDSSRAHLAPWMSWPTRFQSVGDAADLCLRSAAKWLLRTDLAFGLFEPSSGYFHGSVALQEPDWDIRAFEIGYWLRTGSTGKGYMREVVKLVTTMAFQNLEAQRVEIRSNPRNEPSSRVAERLGFLLEGRYRNVGRDPLGQLRDTLVFAAIPEDFDRMQSSWN